MSQELNKCDTAEAIEKFHLLREALFEQAALFRLLKKEMQASRNQDGVALATIGEREAEAWYSSVEYFLMHIGEEVSA